MRVQNKYEMHPSYDDFYVACKDETRQLVENTKYIVNKIENYIASRLEAMEQ